MSKPEFKKPGSLDFYSVASIFAESKDRDWSEGYAERWEILLPKPTLGDVLERAEDLLSDDEKAQAKREPYAPLSEALAEAWEQSDAQDEWRQSFDPMMNFAWPVDLGYEVEAQTAADLIEIFAPSCVLIERTEEDGDDPSYEIALTGGGMYLGDHIAAAYMCCGCVPPVGLLDGLSQAGHSYVLNRLPMATVYAEAQKYLASKAARLAEELERITERASEPA